MMPSMFDWGFYSLNPFLHLLQCYLLSLTLVYPEIGLPFVVCGGCGWVCKPILVFYFGPNQAFGLGLRLGPSRTINGIIYFSWFGLGWGLGLGFAIF